MAIAVLNHWRNGKGGSPHGRAPRTTLNRHRNSRPERQIAEEMRRLGSEGLRLNARRLEICIRQGECLMEAADYIRAAGGIEQWLQRHAIELGIGGTSRTTSANLLQLARAGLQTSQAAVEFVGKHPERSTTGRRQGPDFFVAALRAYNDRQMPLRARPVRGKKADREHILLRKVAWLDDLLHRAMADLEKAVANGWRDNVLKALKAEIEGAWLGDRLTTWFILFRHQKGAQHALFTILTSTQGDGKTAIGRTRDHTAKRLRTKAAALPANVPARKARR